MVMMVMLVIGIMVMIFRVQTVKNPNCIVPGSTPLLNK
jgi:hypothetical protein